MVTEVLDVHVCSDFVHGWKNKDQTEIKSKTGI